MNNVKSSGLTNVEIIDSRNKYGSNALVKMNHDNFFKQFIRSLGDPIIKILLIALGIKTIFLIQDFDWYETVGIVIAIFLASFISTISEYGSEKAFLKLQNEASLCKVKVRRDGKVVLINIDEVVVSDILLLESGDKVAADGVLIKGELTVDEASITGESKEVYKKPFLKGVNPSNNEVLRGSVIYHGIGEVYVTKVGVNTFYGKISLELQEKQPESPLKLRLRELAKVISRIGYFGAFLVAFSYLFSVIVIANNFDINKILGVFSDTSLLFAYILHALTLAVTIIVVSVPEGLPMMITLVLSSNMKRMLKDNVLVRKLMGIETAGSLNILFTDKTGTLTKGELEVVGVMFGNRDYYNDLRNLEKSGYYDNLKKCIMSNTNCSYDTDKKMWIGGNATDKATVSFLNTDNFFVKKIKEVPFDSKNKYSYTRVVEDDKEITYYKGAPEVLLKMCKYYLLPNGKKMSFVDKGKIVDVIDKYARNGIRVLLLAKSDGISKDLIFISLLFIKDELRDNIKDSIELVNKAGIRVVMITGDNKKTALAIAKDASIVNSSSDIILTSDELSCLSDDEVKMIIPNLKVVARALPNDKSRLVRLCEEMDLVVGMTGDGVNDAPALKKADVGFSMGSGTEVAKEASDIILLDNNFNSIVKAILYGRTIFKSIRKFIIFQLTINFCAVFLSIIGPFIGVANPVTVIQMLWVNMVMDTLAGIAFSYEAPLLEYMDEKPKKRDEKILNSYMIHEIIFTSIYSFLLCIFFLKSSFIHSFFRNGSNDIYFMSAFFGLFIFVAIFNSFNARTSRLNIFANLSSNKVFLIVIAFIALVQILLIYYGGSMFRTTSLSIKEMEIMLLCAFSVIPVEFFRKLYLKRKGKLGCV